MTRKIKDTIKQAALWVVAITATMFIKQAKTLINLFGRKNG